MQKFHLSAGQLETASRIDFAELGNQLLFDADKRELYTSNIRMLFILLNEEITSRGMDNEDTVNEYGKALYDLYDALYAQK